jgi:hypothetical protein
VHETKIREFFVLYRVDSDIARVQRSFKSSMYPLPWVFSTVALHFVSLYLLPSRKLCRRYCLYTYCRQSREGLLRLFEYNAGQPQGSMTGRDDQLQQIPDSHHPRRAPTL